MFEYGTGAGGINHGRPFGFLGHAGCDWDEEIFSPRVQLHFIGRKNSINQTGTDFGLPFIRLSHRTHIISAASLL